MSVIRKNYKFKLIRLPQELLRTIDVSPALPDIASKRRQCHSCKDVIPVGQECFSYYFIDNRKHMQRVNQCVECGRQRLQETKARITQYRNYLRKQYKRATYLSERYGIQIKREAEKSL